MNVKYTFDMTRDKVNVKPTLLVPGTKVCVRYDVLFKFA